MERINGPLHFYLYFDNIYDIIIAEKEREGHKMIQEVMMDTQKPKRKGRPSQGKKSRTYTFDQEIVDFYDSYPDGQRSSQMNDWLSQNPSFQQSDFYVAWKRRKGKGDCNGG